MYDRDLIVLCFCNVCNILLTVCDCPAYVVHTENCILVGKQNSTFVYYVLYTDGVFMGTVLGIFNNASSFPQRIFF